MKVKIHTLFEYLLETTQQPVDAVLGFSLATSPVLGDFLAELDPGGSLDWSNESFQGLTRLREHVIARAGLTGRCRPADVLITAGAAEANYLAIMQLVQPGDEIIVDSPGWPQPLVLGEALGAHIKQWHRHEAAHWRLDIDELRALVSPRTRLIFLCNPSNPTGQILTPAELGEIAGLADQVGAHLLCDEVYAGLEWTGERVTAIAGLYERGISTGSVSKALGLQGLRLGWLISQDRSLIFDALVLRENSSEIMNVMGERIAEIALREARYTAAITQAKAEGQQNLALLDDFVGRRPELSWQRPPAGLIGLARLHLPLDSDSLARRLLAPPYKTFLLPGSAYGLPNHIRLGVGGGTAVNLPLGLSRLAQCLDDLAGGQVHPTIA